MSICLWVIVFFFFSLIGPPAAYRRRSYNVLHCICNLSDRQGAAVKSISEFGSWVWHEKLIRHFVQPSPYFTEGMRNLASALPLIVIFESTSFRNKETYLKYKNSYGAPMIGICTAHTLLEQFGPLIFGKLRLIGAPENGLEKSV